MNKNNLVSFLIVTVLGFTASAQIKEQETLQVQPPPDMVGTYMLKQNGIGLQSVRHQLMIFQGTAASDAYIKQLRQKNYACQNIDGRHVKCSRFLKDMQMIGMFDNVYEKYNGQKLEIFPSDYPAELINDAERITEWKKIQNAQWMGKKFTQLYYAVLMDTTQPEDIIKMKFENDRGENSYFYLNGHVGGIDIAFQHTEILKVDSQHSFILEEVLNCLLEVNLVKQ